MTRTCEWGGCKEELGAYNQRYCNKHEIEHKAMMERSKQPLKNPEWYELLKTGTPISPEMAATMPPAHILYDWIKDIPEPEVKEFLSYFPKQPYVAIIGAQLSALFDKAKAEANANTPKNPNQSAYAEFIKAQQQSNLNAQTNPHEAAIPPRTPQKPQGLPKVGLAQAPQRENEQTGDNGPTNENQDEGEGITAEPPFPMPDMDEIGEETRIPVKMKAVEIAVSLYKELDIENKPYQKLIDEIRMLSVSLARIMLEYNENGVPVLRKPQPPRPGPSNRPMTEHREPRTG